MIECEVSTNTGRGRMKTEVKKPIPYVPPHKECFDRWGAKCNWEHMGRLALLRDWPDIICPECRTEWDRVQEAREIRDAERQ